jgi:hypothetical protein
MGKVFILLVLVAGLVIGIMVAVSGGFSCSPGAYCPDGPPSVTSTGGHYDPPDPDIQQDYHPEPAELRAGSAAVAGCRVSEPSPLLDREGIEEAFRRLGAAQELACSFSRQLCSPSSAATAWASSSTMPCSRSPLSAAAHSRYDPGKPERRAITHPSRSVLAGTAADGPR